MSSPIFILFLIVENLNISLGSTLNKNKKVKYRKTINKLF